jgi:hypothetical protein
MSLYIKDELVCADYTYGFFENEEDASGKHVYIIDNKSITFLMTKNEILKEGQKISGEVELFYFASLNLKNLPNEKHAVLVLLSSEKEKI